jgi:hypothetical protein
MTRRTLLVGLVTFALAAWAVGPVVAEDKAGTHEGMVVKAGDGKLTMTNKDGKDERTHAVGPDARISCDGKECKLDELKKGYTVTVTTEKKADDSVVVTSIEAKKAT